MSGGPCDYLQREVDILEEEIQSIVEELRTPLDLRERRRLIQLLAKLRRTDLPRAKQALASCRANPYPHLVHMDGIEVTQAIQHLNQSVELISGKTTVVRVYLSYHANPPITVRGEILVTRPGTGQVFVVASQNQVTLDQAQSGDLTGARIDVRRSLNFVLPKGAAAGKVRVQLQSLAATDTGTPRPVVGQTGRTVTFHQSPPLRVRVLGIRYTRNGATHVPSDTDFNLLFSWLRRAYPVPEVIGSRGVVDVTRGAGVPFDCGDVNAQLAAIRALDVASGTDRRTHYYGLVSDGGFYLRGCAAVPSTPDPSAVGCGPTGPGTWGWDFDGSYGDWYCGHELGHTFGRLHPGFCGETNDDPNYPHPNGQLADSDAGDTGFDVGEPGLGVPMAALPGTMWHDVMTYCNRQWLSRYTYDGIRARLVAENGLPSGAALPGGGGRPDERFPELATTAVEGAGAHHVSVVARVNLTRNEGSIRFVNPVPGGPTTGLDDSSAVALRVRDADGGLLGEYRVAVKVDSTVTPETDRTGLVDPWIPAGRDARTIELVVDGVVADTFQAGAAVPPAEQFLVSSGAEGPTVARAPGATAAEGVSYAVQVSTDEGATWTTLAVGLESPEVAIDPAQVPGARQVVVRVIATNGFTRSVVEAGTVELGGDEPAG